MLESPLYFWISFGAVLIIAETLLPGLVSVFIGLGALTVAALLHFHYIDDLSSQLVAWFASSTFYIFSLRLLIIKYYPSDTQKQDIDEDAAMVGLVVEVVEEISKEKTGRIRQGETTWTAITHDDHKINVGEKVRILSRDNISWVVEKVSQQEN
jgi:inner membrane protein